MRLRGGGEIKTIISVAPSRDNFFLGLRDDYPLNNVRGAGRRGAARGGAGRRGAARGGAGRRGAARGGAGGAQLTVDARQSGRVPAWGRGGAGLAPSWPAVRHCGSGPARCAAAAAAAAAAVASRPKVPASSGTGVYTQGTS